MVGRTPRDRTIRFGKFTHRGYDHVVKLKSIQALRSIASLMVVGDHLPRVEGKLFHDGLMSKFGAAGAIGVDLFFVISGFIMIVTTWDAFATNGASGRFLERRVLRIYPPYWVAFLAFLCVSAIAPHLQRAGPLNAWTVVTSLLLIPHESGPIMFVAWSLAYEMYFYLVFASALRFPRDRLRTFIATWIVATLVLNVVSFYVHNVVLSFVGNPLTFEFIAGVGIGVLVHERRVFAPRAILICGVLLTIAVAVYSSRFDGFGTYSLDWYRVVAATPGMAMIVYGAVTLEEQTRLSVASALVRMGDASYTTYLWHGMLLGTFTAAVAHFRPHGTIADAAFLLGGYAVVIVGSQIIYRIVEAPLVRLLQRAGLGARRDRATPRLVR
jgi:peptidoglycan/LPS O-acetylase OafA/YrhL